MSAAYLALHASGELARRADEARRRLAACRICPRACGVNRLAGERGQCRTAELAVVCSFHAHHGEEAPLSGEHGSGTIFFTWCSLRCVFCQNAEISQQGEGSEVKAAELAAMMLSLQRAGCHNINFVTPTHLTPQILEALQIAASHGLRLPLVYNSSGYDSVETLRLLDGVIDIYMPDMKYADAAVGQRLSGIAGYPAVNQAAVREMHRQVGDLTLDRQGIAVRGLLVRHLVLPNGLAGSREVMRFLGEEISRDTYVNIMNQYRPCHEARRYPEIERPITMQEYREAVNQAAAHGLTRLDSALPLNVLPF